MTRLDLAILASRSMRGGGHSAAHPEIGPAIVAKGVGAEATFVLENPRYFRKVSPP